MNKEQAVSDPATAEAGPKSPLGVRPFRYLWLNTLTFAMVANALRFVYGWVVLDGLDGNESAQGLVVFLLGLPGIFLLLPAGVWADRVNRRMLLIGSQIGTGLVMVVSAALIGAGQLSMALLVISALAAGVTTAVGSPVRNSLVPELLPKRLLLSGIALNAVAMTLSLVVGSVTAQLVGDRFGFDGAFWYMAILMGLGLVALLFMATPPHQVRDSGRPGMRVAIREGLAFVGGQPALRILFALLGLAGFVMNALMFVTLQAMVKEDLGRDAGDAAPLLAMIGLGLMFSSLLIMKKGDMPKKGTVFLRAMICGTSVLTLMGRATEYWQLVVLCLLMGFAGGFFINMNQGLIQSNTPNELMGRVMGLFTVVSAGLTPVGALVMGVLGSSIGPANTMTLCAGLALLAVVWTYFRTTALHEMES